MKKLFSLLVIAGMAAMVACGPSAEEKAAKEKAKADSIAAVEKAKADSIAAVEQAKTDSIAAAEKAKADSIAAAAAQPKKGGKATTPKAKPTTVKPGQGKG